MEKKDNKKARPHLQVDTGILQLTVKDKDGKEIVNAKTFSAKIVYAYLLGWLNSSDEVFPGAKRIAKDTGVGTNQVAARCVDDLEKWGWISIERRRGYSHRYTIKPLQEVIRINDQKGDKQPVINEPVSEPVEVVPEPAQHCVTRNFPSYDGLFDDRDQVPCWDAKPKQTIPHATPSVKNKYFPGDIDLFGSDDKPTFTPPEPKKTTIVKDEEVKYLGLMRTFMCYWNDGKFEGISDFKKGMEIFKPLVEKSLNKPITIPEEFYECLTNFNDDVADKWGTPF